MPTLVLAVLTAIVSTLFGLGNGLSPFMACAPITSKSLLFFSFHKF